MLWKASDLVGYAIEATDGKIGSVEDLLFDQRNWTVRWAVIDTGDWLPGRTVLLPSARLVRPDAGRKVLEVALSRVQVENSPDIGTDPPVSRQQELLIYDYYGWAPYWDAGLAGPIAMPPVIAPLYAAGGKPTRPREAEGDPKLRSVRDVKGYHIHARDGNIGHVEDFLVDSNGWAIRYMVVDTKNWWPGKKVLVAPHWVTDINWSERTVTFDVTRDRIKASPEFDASATLDRAYEERLHGHYDQPTYWL